MRKLLSCALAAALVFCPLPAMGAEEQEGPVEGTSALSGKVLGQDGKPLDGVQVLAYHLASEELYTSAPTQKGQYRLKELPYGFFDLAVRTPQGLFVGNKVVNIAPSGKAVISFNLAAFDDGGNVQGRSFPGAAAQPDGLAEMKEKPVGREFWKSPKGIAILGGIGGAILLGIAVSSKESDSSPSQ